MWNTQNPTIHLRLLVASLIWTFLGLKDGIRAFPSPMHKAITGSGDMLQSTSSLLDDSVRLGSNAQRGTNAGDNLGFGSRLSRTNPDGGQQVSDLRNVHRLEGMSAPEDFKGFKGDMNKNYEKRPFSKASDVKSREMGQIEDFLKDPEMPSRFGNTVGKWQVESKKSNDLYKELNRILDDYLVSQNSPIPSQKLMNSKMYSDLYEARILAARNGKEFDEGLELVNKIKDNPFLEGYAPLDEAISAFMRSKKTSDEAYLGIAGSTERHPKVTNPNQVSPFPISASEIIHNGNARHAKAKGIVDRIRGKENQINAFVKPHSGTKNINGDITWLEKSLRSANIREADNLKGYEKIWDKFIQSQDEAQKAHREAYRDALIVFFDPKNGQNNPMVWQDYMRTKELVIRNQALKEGRVLTSEEARFAHEYHFISTVSASRETPLQSLTIEDQQLQKALEEFGKTNVALKQATQKSKGSKITNWFKKSSRKPPPEAPTPQVIQEPLGLPPTWLLARNPSKVYSNVS